MSGTLNFEIFRKRRTILFDATLQSGGAAMSPVYPQQFQKWMPNKKVFWVYPDDFDTVSEYKNGQRVGLKHNAVYHAAIDANDLILRLLQQQ